MGNIAQLCSAATNRSLQSQIAVNGEWLASTVTKNRDLLERSPEKFASLYVTPKEFSGKHGKSVKQRSVQKIRRLNGLVEGLCGIYSRVARRLGVHRTYVSRVARGERRSKEVENALIAEYERTQKGKHLP